MDDDYEMGVDDRDSDNGLPPTTHGRNPSTSIADVLIDSQNSLMPFPSPRHAHPYPTSPITSTNCGKA